MGSRSPIAASSIKEGQLISYYNSWRKIWRYGVVIRKDGGTIYAKWAYSIHGAINCKYLKTKALTEIEKRELFLHHRHREEELWV